jgi:hypothetical protein
MRTMAAPCCSLDGYPGYHGIVGKQGKLPSELAVQAHAMGERFAYVRILSVERNACDFVIAFYLGEYLAADPTAECIILSKDKKGFDPLVRHLIEERGFQVRRVRAQKDAFPDDDHGPSPGDPFERLTRLLKKEKAFPHKRKGLEGKVKSWFPQMSTQDRGLLVQRLFDDGFVNEWEKLLTFVSTRFRGV